jgi:hypothetical protein
MVSELGARTAGDFHREQVPGVWDRTVLRGLEKKGYKHSRFTEQLVQETDN